MENANKALLIAGSTLVGVLLFTMMIVFLSRISAWPETEDEIENTEQIAAFNAEYEVYQKSAMYGVDVISCLNKAKSNNDRYVEGKGFFGTPANSETFQINVIVEIKTALSESIEVTAIKPNARGGYSEGAVYDNRNVQPNTTLEDVFGLIDGTVLTDFDASAALKYNMTPSITNHAYVGEYQLIGDTVLQDLIKHSNNPKKTVKNTLNDDYIYDSTKNLYGWSSATWTTYLYSFKQKRFKCTNLEYSNKTGCINLIRFEEI